MNSLSVFSLVKAWFSKGGNNVQPKDFFFFLGKKVLILKNSLLALSPSLLVLPRECLVKTAREFTAHCGHCLTRSLTGSSLPMDSLSEDLLLKY